MSATYAELTRNPSIIPFEGELAELFAGLAPYFGPNTRRLALALGWSRPQLRDITHQRRAPEPAELERMRQLLSFCQAAEAAGVDPFRIGYYLAEVKPMERLPRSRSYRDKLAGKLLRTETAAELLICIAAADADSEQKALVSLRKRLVQLAKAEG